MYNYSGIIYRIWGMGATLSAIGLVLFLLSLVVKAAELQKRFSIVGVVFFILGVGIAFEYASILKDPEIQVFEGYFSEEYRNSRVAPPLPFTWKHTFINEDGVSDTCYLDTFSKKEIFDEDFMEGVRYRIYYEDSYDIIVYVEVLN